MSTARYRKKPVEIEAHQVRGTANGELVRQIAQWCGGTPGGTFDDPHILIPTLEGTMRAKAGDYVIRGVQGEFYPCKPDIFEATYDPA